MIKLEHVQKTYPDGGQVLKDVNAVINKGDVIALIGPSGTGKSTLLRCINMLDAPTGGKIFLDGDEITAEGYPMENVHKKVCMVFQSYNLFEHLSAIENVMLPQTEVLKKDRQEAYDVGMDLLAAVGMGQKSKSYPKALSGGQKQRVAIARTLAMGPEIVLFDEPTSALDPASVGEVKDVIKKIAKSGVTCLIVTHDMELARDITNRVFYMDQGIIYEEGTPEEIFENPKKERTIEFIRKFKTMEENINDRKFDYPALMSGIQGYCTSNHLPLSTILSTQLLSEELICTILFAILKDPFRIHMIYEYDKTEQQMRITAEYSGEKNNIFDSFDFKEFEGEEMELEQFRAAVQILMSKIDGFEYNYQEKKTCPNTITIKLKKGQV
ncbi:MAG: amino acid ABC transporter ATP-binding protein [Lachnospiraceae bacterium]|nr:amino acid ABC transporter ATP-binding protein [Lachnospiraceae bacterium]